MKLIFLGLSLVSGAAQAICHFEKMEVSEKTESSSIFKIDQNESLHAEGPDKEHRLHDGSIWMYVKDKKKCEIKGDIFSGLLIDKRKKILMTQEYSGSESYNQIINLKNCKNIGEKLTFYGTSEIEKNTLISKPGCEPMKKELGSCISGQVFMMSKKNCKLTLDKKASRALTKKILGIELPSFNKAFTVRNPYTPSALIVSDLPSSSPTQSREQSSGLPE